MRSRLLFLLLLVSGVASAQYTPTGSKTRFVNGIGLGTKSDAAFGTVDSLVLYASGDSTLKFKYKGTARALAYASQLSGYVPFTGSNTVVSLGSRLNVGGATDNPLVALNVTGIINGSSNLNIVANAIVGGSMNALTFTTTGSYVSVVANNEADARLLIQNTGTNGKQYALIAGNPGVDETGFSIYRYLVGNILRFDTSNNANFSNNIFLGAGKYIGYNSSTYFSPEDNIQGARVKTGGGFVVDIGSTMTITTLGTGTLYSNSGVLTNTNPSDSTIKNTIKPLSYGLAEILKLKPKTFYYNSDSAKTSLKYGFIAQEVKPIMPDLVRKISKGSDKLGLETDGIYVTLVKAIQEQQAIIDDLKKRIIALENK